VKSAEIRAIRESRGVAFGEAMSEWYRNSEYKKMLGQN